MSVRWRSWTAVVNFQYNYGSALNGTTSLPPYLNFFGGGPDSTSGPKDVSGE